MIPLDRLEIIVLVNKLNCRKSLLYLILILIRIVNIKNMLDERIQFNWCFPLFSSFFVVSQDQEME